MGVLVCFDYFGDELFKKKQLKIRGKIWGNYSYGL
jgi:hypothetical protein